MVSDAAFNNFILRMGYARLSLVIKNGQKYLSVFCLLLKVAEKADFVISANLFYNKIVSNF